MKKHTITREMIKCGFRNNLISIEDDYAGCIGICCRIGKLAFYFAGLDDEGLSKEEWWNVHSLDETVDMLYEATKDSKSAAEIGVFPAEYNYYELLLQENLKKEIPAMKERILQYLTSGEETISETEDFLGYAISSDILEEKEMHIKEVLEQMTAEEIAVFFERFGSPEQKKEACVC